MRDLVAYKNALLKKLSRTRFLSLLIVWLEALTRSGWRLLTWALLFSALWLLQIPAIFGTQAILLCAVLFAAGVIVFAYKDLRHFKAPDKNAVDRRIEQASKLDHHPLSALEDSLANPGKDITRLLWQKNVEQAHARLSKIRPAFLKAFMAALDPHAVRLGVLLLFGIGMVVAGSEWKERIIDGAFPYQLVASEAPAESIILTITPPEYTKGPQLVLKGSIGDQDTALKIPEGSQLKIHVNGGIGTPKLTSGDQSWELENSGDDHFFLEMPVPSGDGLTLSQFFVTRAKWAYEIVQDQPPTITATGEPEILPDGVIRFPMSVNDDYGVQTLSVHMSLDAGIDKPPIGSDLVETRPIMSPAGTEFEIAPLYDLTYHTWAGLPVTFHFTVSDHKGQTAEIKDVKLVLPERKFEHPVAKVLIAIRKMLAWNPLEDYNEHKKTIAEFVNKPRLYQDDLAVFLSMSSMMGRFHWSQPSIDNAQDLIMQLWDTAIHIESGNLELAARNLRDAQRHLEHTLRDPNSTQQDITEAMNDVRQALSEYLMEMQKEMQKRVETGEAMPYMPDMLMQNINPEDFANFLDEMEQRMLNGDRQGAEEMLSQMQRFMDMMQPWGNAPLPQDVQVMNEGINELKELIDRQKELLEQTQEQIATAEYYSGLKRRGSETLDLEPELMEEWGLNDLPPAPEIQDHQNSSSLMDFSVHKVEQEALRLILGQLMLDAAEALDEIPETMGLAEYEMRGSSDTLGKNEPVESVPHQEQAIVYLEQAQKELQEMLSQRMQQLIGFAVSGSGMRYDPMGRPYGGDNENNGLFPGSRVEIPNEAEKKRAHEILRLLRRRSGELDRPQNELDYYRRLLKQF